MQILLIRWRRKSASTPLVDLGGRRRWKPPSKVEKKKSPEPVGMSRKEKEAILMGNAKKGKVKATTRASKGEKEKAATLASIARK